MAGKEVGTSNISADIDRDNYIVSLLERCEAHPGSSELYMSDLRFADCIQDEDELLEYFGDRLYKLDHEALDGLTLIEGEEGVPRVFTCLKNIKSFFMPSTSGVSGSRDSSPIGTVYKVPSSPSFKEETPMCESVLDLNDLFFKLECVETPFVFTPGVIRRDIAPLVFTGPKAVFPIEGEAARDPEWPYGALESTNKATGLPFVSPTGLLPAVVCPVYDLDNRCNRKTFASYKLRVPTKTPKEKRDHLVKLARDRKLERNHDLTFETQMFTINHKLDKDAVSFACGEIKNCAESLEHRITHDLGTNTNHLLASTISRLEQVVADVSLHADKFYDCVDSVTESAQQATANLTKAFWVVPLVVACLCGAQYLANKARGVFITACSFVLSCVLPVEVWSKISEHFSHKKIETQSGVFDVKTISHIMTLLATYFTVGGRDPLGVAVGFAKSMSTYSRSISGWKDLSVFVLDFFENFINYIRLAFGADRIKLYNTGLRKVDEWCTKVMDVANKSNTGGDIMTPDNVKLIMNLREEGTLLANTYRFSSEVSPALHKYLGYLDDICRTCSAAMHMAKGGRAPPTVMALVGKPGVGKSFLTGLISGCVLTAILDKETMSKPDFSVEPHIYQKPNSEYWNGYCGQEVFVKDDWGQNVPVAGIDNDFITLIMANSTWAFPLNFADLENKGKNFFSSKFILLTTNIENLDSSMKVIMEPDAVARRIDFGWKITVNPEFAEQGKIDMKKVVKYHRLNGKFPMHAWSLRRHFFGVGSAARTENKVYTLDQAITMAKEHLVESLGYYESNQDMIRKVIMDQFETQSGEFNYGSTVYNNIVYGIDAVFSENKVVENFLQNAMIKSLISFVATMISTFLIITAVKFVCSLVFKAVFSLWNTGKDMVKRALQKKSGVPDEVLAQMIDSFRPCDFEVAVEGDDGYKVEQKFTLNALWKAYQRLGGAAPQSNQPDQLKFVHRNVVGTRVVESQDKSLAEIQADTYGNTMVDIVRRNLYQFRLRKGEKSVTLGHILFVRDTSAIMPFHFISELEAGFKDGIYDDSFILDCINTVTTEARNVPLATFMSLERKSMPEVDIVSIKFPRSFRSHTDIVDKFIVENDLHNMRKFKVRLETAEGTDRLISRARHMTANKMDHVVITSSGGEYTLVTGFEYYGHTVKGDCGGFVSLDDAPGNQCRRVFGLHVAGAPSRGVGICNVVTQKILLDILGLGLVSDVPVVETQKTDSYFSQGSFVFRRDGVYRHRLNPISSLHRTKLHNQWGHCLKAPAKLRTFINKDGQKIDPMKKALEPYSSPVVSLDSDLIRRAAYNAFKPFRAETVDHERRIYTKEEAASGGPDLGFNGIPRGTSPGYPYCFEGHSSKKAFYGSLGPYSFDSSDCKIHFNRVDNIIADAKKGKRSEHIFVDFLKDELRPFQKVDEGRTRLISGSPLDYVLAFRMYFMAFLKAAQDTRILNGVAVGINPYTEWDLLARHLMSKGNKCVAGDFKAFDASEQPDVHWAILDQINAWYNDGEENALVRRVLWMEVVHSRHYGAVFEENNSVYQWTKSLPSGHPATSIINSFYNLIVFNMCWLKLTPVSYGPFFWKYVYLCVYGDDNVLNISDEVIIHFNQRTITDAMREFGMTYTSENKDLCVTDHRELSEISFLKRNFRFEAHVGGYVGPQDLDSLIHIPYWCKDYRMEDDITRANLEFVYTELSLHDPEVWDEWAVLIDSKARELIGHESVFPFTRCDYIKNAQTATFVWPL